MSVKYRVGKMTLNYRDEKPEVYKTMQLTYPVIKEDALIEYISNSSNLPKTTVQSCVMAIAEGISYFVINGHRVSFSSFGAFYLNVHTKCAKTVDECKADLVTGISIGFQSNSELTDLARKVEVSEQKSLSVKE